MLEKGVLEAEVVEMILLEAEVVAEEVALAVEEAV